MFCTLCTGGTHEPSPNSDQKGVLSQDTSTSPRKSNSPTLSSKQTSLTNTNSTMVINTADHTVIPFSVAIKRMSEILIYKANECTAKVRFHISGESLNKLFLNISCYYHVIIFLLKLQLFNS